MSASAFLFLTTRYEISRSPLLPDQLLRHSKAGCPYRPVCLLLRAARADCKPAGSAASAGRRSNAEHRGTRSDCLNKGDCGRCQRVYCDLVATGSIQAIKDMMFSDRDREEIHADLASRFRDIGFERNVPGLEAF